MASLIDCLDNLSGGDPFTLRQSFMTPGFIAVLAAQCYRVRLPRREFTVTDSQVRSYLGTIGFERAVWGEDPYTRRRRSEGSRYSTLVHIRNASQVDRATATIISCISADLPDERSKAKMTQMIGELHDNVWAHGNRSGFSIAQRFDPDGIEFAVADIGIGIGFERELAAHGIAKTGKQAIEWCLQAGNSSKQRNGHNDEDEWAQRLPEDAIGNPYGRKIATTRSDDNHHAGLGLYYLKRLIEGTQGSMQIASGSCRLQVSDGNHETWSTGRQPWNGVAISCRLHMSKVQQFARSSSNIANDLRSIFGVEQ